MKRHHLAPPRRLSSRRPHRRRPAPRVPAAAVPGSVAPRHSDRSQSHRSIQSTGRHRRSGTRAKAKPGDRRGAVPGLQGRRPARRVRATGRPMGRPASRPPRTPAAATCPRLPGAIPFTRGCRPGRPAAAALNAQALHPAHSGASRGPRRGARRTPSPPPRAHSPRPTPRPRTRTPPADTGAAAHTGEVAPDPRTRTGRCQGSTCEPHPS